MSGLNVNWIADDTARICEAAIASSQRVYFHLFTSPAFDLLVDFGWGVGWTLKDLPRASDKPLVGIATHSHCDHIGRFADIDIRLAHMAEADIYADPTPEAVQAFPYLDGLDILSDGGCLTRETYAIAPCPLSGVLQDGQSMVFGDDEITTIHTPGHSPGSICLHFARRRMLVCADAVHDGRILDDIPGADRTDMLLSHKKLNRIDFDLALPGHGGMLDRQAFATRIRDYAQATGPAQ